MGQATLIPDHLPFLKKKKKKTGYRFFFSKKLFVQYVFAFLQTDLLLFRCGTPDLMISDFGIGHQMAVIHEITALRHVCSHQK